MAPSLAWQRAVRDSPFSVVVQRRTTGFAGPPHLARNLDYAVPIVVTEPEHPYVGAWWPPGHLLGYEHTFTHEAADFLTAIGGGVDPAPSFADGLRVQRVLAAVEDSAGQQSTWTTIGESR